ncbi:S41 family peptidase [Kutzneria albida]|uniref:Peptidase S41 n=1 Tax=Kutzneria albida DSM 43870 TaxID=1449976 RepID=W5W4A7_9PSEU|nr:S41 family peptidase [Kutzneria albida]AHH96073.1 peptidase S41 [Kutzneria albida DSM 43870]
MPEDNRAAEIDLLTLHLQRIYVFPEVAERAIALLRERSAANAYAGLDDQRFAELVTEHLLSVSGDKHLRLLHSVEELPENEDPEWFDEDLYRAEAELSGHGFDRVERLAGNVGLLETTRLFDPDISGAAAAAAMNLLAGTDVLLLDLRRNGGGSPGMVAMLCSYLLKGSVHLCDMYFRAEDRTRQSWTLPYVPGPRFGHSKPVYVLTSAQTFSGAEELAYNLQQLERATLIGEVTKGGAHPGNRQRIGPHLRAAVPAGRSINPVSGTNWEGVGVRPHLELPAEQAFDRAYRLALEHVLGLGETGPRRVIAEQARVALAGLARG